MSKGNSKAVVAALYGLFFLSGASALAYQIAWTRMLSMGLGQELPAVLAVIGAIFGGMGVGAWGGERILARVSRPGRWYGWLELGIGVWGFASIPLLAWLNARVPEWIGLESSAFTRWLVSLAVPGLALLPATAAMGATFPALERYLAPFSGRGRCVGGLYAANTLGAVAGVIASISLALPSLGFARTIALFSAVSLFCGLAAMALAGRLQCAHPPARPAEADGSHLPLGWALWASGLLGIGFEVLGVRALAEILENTVYTFAAALSVYLLGIAAGGGLYQKSGRRWNANRLFLWLSIASLAGAWMLACLPDVYRVLRRTLGDSAIGFWAAEFLTAGCVFALPSLLMGAVFSHLVQSAKERALGVGAAVGLNTFGAALAPWIFGVVLPPWLGLKWSFAILGLGYLGLAWPLTGWPLWLAVAPMALAVSLPSQLPSIPPGQGQRVIARLEGVSGSAAVVEAPDGNRSLVVNHRFMMGGTGATTAERRHASLPLLLHPNPKRALFLGLGTGITFAGAGPHPGLSADGVELAPEIVQLLPWFAPQNALPEDPGRFKIFVADARRFVRVCPGGYDVIIADLFHPARDGAGPLYSLEHFRAIREKLAPGGLACQWLPLHQLDEPTLRIIIRTFLEAFPNTRAFLLRFNVDTPVLGLVGALENPLYDAEYFERRVRDPHSKQALRTEQIPDLFHLLGCFVAGPEALRRFSGAADLNTDDRPVVLFRAPRFSRAQTPSAYGRLMGLLASCESPPEQLLARGAPSNETFATELRGFIVARDSYLRGLVAENEGDLDLATESFIESSRLSPRFSSGYAHLLSIAMRESLSNPASARRLLERLAAAQPERPVATQLLNRLFP